MSRLLRNSVFCGPHTWYDATVLCLKAYVAAFCGGVDVADVIAAEERFKAAISGLEPSMSADAGVALPSLLAHLDISCAARDSLKSDEKTFREHSEAALTGMMALVTEEEGAPDAKGVMSLLSTASVSIHNLRKCALHALDKEFFNECLIYADRVLFPVMNAVLVYRDMTSGKTSTEVHDHLSSDPDCHAFCNALSTLQEQATKDGDNKHNSPLRKMLRLFGGSGPDTEIRYKLVFDWMNRFAELMGTHKLVMSTRGHEALASAITATEKTMKSGDVTDSAFQKSLSMKEISSLKVALAKLYTAISDHTACIQVYGIDAEKDENLAKAHAMADDAEYHCVRWAVVSFMLHPTVSDKGKGTEVRRLLRGIIDDQKNSTGDKILKRLPMDRINEILALDEPEEQVVESKDGADGDGDGADAAPKKKARVAKAAPKNGEGKEDMPKKAREQGKKRSRD